MNSFRTAGRLVTRLAFGAAFLAIAAVCQAAVEKGAAKVVALQGPAEISQDGKQWTPLRKGETLHEGSIIRTAGATAADLDLGRNGSRLRIMPNSTVALTALSYTETGVETIVNTQIDLRAGRVLGNVHKLAAASKYEVKTPKAVAGIKGTRYDISSNGKVVVAEGSVVVVSLQDDGTTVTRVVNASEAFSPVTGMVAAATADELGDVGGSASSVPGIAALPPLQGRFFDSRTAIDRVVLPTDTYVSRTQPKDAAAPAPVVTNEE